MDPIDRALLDALEVYDALGATADERPGPNPLESLPDLESLLSDLDTLIESWEDGNG